MNNIVIFDKSIRNSLLIIQFICLVLFTDFTSSVTLNDLKVVCDIHDGSSGVVTLDKLPSYCTAAATSRNSIENINIMLQKPKSKPFVFFLGGVTYDQWSMYLNTAGDVINFMNEKQFDAVLFDNMYNRADNFDENFNQQLITFFQNLKQTKPDGLYGLVLPKEENIIPHAFNYLELDQYVDFYLLPAIFYRECKFDYDMRKVTEFEEVENSVRALQIALPSGSMSKVLLSMQVFSLGITEHAKKGAAFLTYSEMCGYKGKTLSTKRKYCKDSLEELYDKSALCYNYKMLGAYIQYIDTDDFAGSCKCTGDDKSSAFPATSVISRGIQGIEVKELTGCEDFGKPNN